MSEETPTRSDMVNSYMAAANECTTRLYEISIRMASLTKQGENFRPAINDSVREMQRNVKLTSMWLVDIAAQTESIILEEDSVNENMPDQ